MAEASAETGSTESITYLKSILTIFEKSKDYDLIKQYLEDCIGSNQPSEDEKKRSADSWLYWAGQQTMVKVVSADIPEGILPQGLTGRILDAKVFAKGRPDDPIYDNHPEIRAKVARGNCFLEIENGADKSATCWIYALKKFTGGLGDDDDTDREDDVTWRRYFLKPLEEAKWVVCTRKANGEAGHFSCRKLAGHYMLCAGSKNVHMVFRTRDDINKYQDGRFLVAKEVSLAVMTLLEEMTEEEKIRLLDFLCFTEFTVVFEILQPSRQHVEDLSYLKRSKLQFIAWTSCNLEATEDKQLCSMPPDIAIQIAVALGLPSVDYTVIPASDVDNRMLQVRQGYGYEGEVFYFLDSTRSVMGLLKKKTIWYIVCRAIREKSRSTCQQNNKSPSTFSLSKALNKTERRIDEIQKWLNLDNGSVKLWKNLGTKFVRWCVGGVDRGNITVAEVADLFPVLWKRYLEESHLTDKVHSSWTELSASDT